MTAIACVGVTARFGAVEALRDASFEVRARTLTAIVGPNGAGKSTVVKAIAGLIPYSGLVRIDAAGSNEGLGRLALMAQHADLALDFPITVGDVALMGRVVQRGWFRRFTSDDRAAAEAAMALTGVTELRGRHIGALSGGQRQRALLARALAQGASILLLDEPFAGVDAASEALILEALRRHRDVGGTVVVVHHDLGTVGEMFDDVVLLNRSVVAYGPVADVLDDERLLATYGRRVSRRARD